MRFLRRTIENTSGMRTKGISLKSFGSFKRTTDGPTHRFSHKETQQVVQLTEETKYLTTHTHAHTHRADGAGPE